MKCSPSLLLKVSTKESIFTLQLHQVLWLWSHFFCWEAQVVKGRCTELGPKNGSWADGSKVRPPQNDHQLAKSSHPEIPNKCQEIPWVFFWVPEFEARKRIQEFASVAFVRAGEKIAFFEMGVTSQICKNGENKNANTNTNESEHESVIVLIIIIIIIIIIFRKMFNHPPPFNMFRSLTPTFTVSPTPLPPWKKQASVWCWDLAGHAYWLQLATPQSSRCPWRSHACSPGHMRWNCSFHVVVEPQRTQGRAPTARKIRGKFKEWYNPLTEILQ